MNNVIRFVSLLTVLFLASCKSTQMKGLVYNLDQEKTTTKVNARVNDTLTFKMEGNPSTGYRWHSNIDEHDANLKVVTNAYEENNNKPKGIVGAPSTHVYQYVPLKAGNYTINFEYKRGWENGVPPIKKKTVMIKVD